nr:uncharacterized protein LOC121122526 [Lepeophtheirus salmonis]
MMKFVMLLSLAMAAAFVDAKPSCCHYNGQCYQPGSIITTFHHCCMQMTCSKGGTIYTNIIGKPKTCGCCRDPYNGKHGLIQNGGYGKTKFGRRFFCCDGRLVLTFSFVKPNKSPSRLLAQ